MSLVRDNIQHKVFKNGPSKICGRQSLKNLKWYGLPKHLSFVICPICRLALKTLVMTVESRNIL